MSSCGKTWTKDGKVKRPPMTPLSWVRFSMWQARPQERRGGENRSILVIAKKEEIKAGKKSNGEVESLALEAKIAGTFAKHSDGRDICCPTHRD